MRQSVLIPIPFTPPRSTKTGPFPSPFPWKTTDSPQSSATGFRYGFNSPVTPLASKFGQESGRERSFDWVAENGIWKRNLGPTELSYYLGSRGGDELAGVNDMYLSIGFTAPSASMNSDRVVSIWSELISRHPLLAATVEFTSFEEVDFCYDPLSTAEERRERAKSSLALQTGISGKEVIDKYLNGRRTLSNSRVATLIISNTASEFSNGTDSAQDYYFNFFTTHFVGDGMALHTTANEFFLLLSSENDSIEIVAQSLKNNESAVTVTKKLPVNMESKITLDTSNWKKAISKVDFENDQAKLVGGQTFTRAKLGIRKTINPINVNPTIIYDKSDTSRILKRCKENGVTIANCIFALSSLAFIRSGNRDGKLACMIYSALNIRPWLDSSAEDWFHIAIGYYNIILPSFFPSTLTPTQVFWLRSKSVKSQTSKVVKSKFVKSRIQLMARERERRSIGFEQEDEKRRVRDQVLVAGVTGLGLGFEFKDVEKKKEIVRILVEPVKSRESSVESELEEPVKKIPSLALMGVSMLGNLDSMYHHSSFSSITLTSLQTGSRQRPASILLFAYTFTGKLFLSLGYDCNGFEQGSIEKWWNEVEKGVEEFLLV